MGGVAVCLWYDGDAEAAAELYVSLVPDSAITEVFRQNGKALMVHFTLAGQRFQALNGGPMYKHTPAASIVVPCATQADIDRVWDGLLDGGSAMQCGWLTDRYGVSWQVLPESLGRFIGDPDPARAGRAMAAMLQMVKLDIGGLEAAWRGD
jgi:predicted 3-demethylubiquinone-9 3-methyltransferase (glyoxalase superfamily)